MAYRSWLSAALLVLASTVALATRPNVLFIYADDLRADALGTYGNREIRTPTLDAIAAHGTVFERAYVMGGHHGAICIPSRAMMLTGRSLFRANESMQGQTTWPRQFASAGYQTFATGKWHNGRDAFAESFDNGATVFFGGMTEPEGASVVDLVNGVVGATTREPGHLTEAITDAALAFLRRADRDKPLVCYVAFTAPHDPRKAPVVHHLSSEVRPMALPPNFLPQHPFDNGELKVRDELLAGFPRGVEEVRGHWRDYRAMIEHMDGQIRRLVDALGSTGRGDNTVIVFAGDNGLALGSHGLMGKQSLYEHSARVPILVAGPGVKEGRRTQALCSLFDLYPTLTDLAGLPVPQGVEGQSLGRILRGRPGGREALLLAYRDVQRAVVEDRWKYIVYPKAGVEQLFDLRSDPFEITNLAASPAHTPHLVRLRESLRRMGLRFGDPLAPIVEAPSEPLVPIIGKRGKGEGSEAPRPRA